MRPSGVKDTTESAMAREICGDNDKGYDEQPWNYQLDLFGLETARRGSGLAISGAPVPGMVPWAAKILCE